MARIYRAEHEGLQRQVALKVLTDSAAPGTEGRARFLREARIAAAIKHPNVVNIFDVGLQNRIPYLVMELLVGQDLEGLLHSHGALDESTIIDIFIPVVAGLVAVHDAGVVHRDLKPGNIFLSERGDEIEPKLLDFGISKAAGGDNLRVTSATRNLLLGTPLYMSPEALMGGDMSALSDQYSLGVMIYECATGINPFMADTVLETARRVTTGDYPRLAEQPVRPSRRLSSIIERAMNIEPSQRFSDMRALGQELLNLAGQRTRITWSLTFNEVAAAARAEHALAVEDSRSALVGSKRTSTGRRHWPMAAAAVMGLSALAALLTWPVERGSEPREDGSAPPAPAPAALLHSSSAPESVALPLQPTPQRAGAGRAAKHLGEPELEQRARQPSFAGQEDTRTETRTRSEERSRRDPPIQSRPPSRTPTRATRSARQGTQRPDWLILPSDRAGVRPQMKAVQLGTNEAPIFD
jgi:serine/threonine-protein kinase